MIKNWKFLLICIFLVAGVLRVLNLSNIPPSPDWDEVAYGYNAYSLLQTGKDEYGSTLPPVLKSFGDYKPALYSYLSIPSVATLGLNTFSVRLPNAVFGALGAVALFFLVRSIFKRDDLALLSSFFLAVSPWSIQFSRFSHEAVVGVTLNILTALFFIKGLKSPRYLPLAAFFSALSLYSYQSEKLFTPLLVLLLFAVFIKDVLKIPKRYIGLSILTGLIVAAPMLLFTVKDSGSLDRARGTSIFSYQTEVLDKSAKQLIEDRKNNNYLGLLINNRRVVYAKKIAQNYLSHFDPNWLFFKGDLPRHHPPNMGILYLFSLPFILLGIFGLVLNKDPIKIEKKYKLLIFGWMFIAIIPSALTYDAPHAGRSMNLLPVPQILSAIGVLVFLYFIKQRFRKYLKLSIIIVGFLFIINFSYYLKQYFVNLNTLYSSEWQYGYEEAIEEVEKIKGNYDKVVISDKSPMDQSYMFFLFFLNYPPDKYHAEQDSRHSFNEFEFRSVEWEEDAQLENALIVGSPKDIPRNANKLKVINFLNGQPAIILAESNTN